MSGTNGAKRDNWAFPLAALVLFGLIASGIGTSLPAFTIGLQVLLVPVLFGTVFAAVHHAEVIAARTGEPYGTLVLTMSVTVIEVALIASLMLKPDANPALARDTVFAVIMIVCNGLVGLCVLLGGLRHGELGFRVKGASAYLAVLAPLSTLSLILPNYTLTTPGPVYAGSQLAFVSAVTLALYGAFLYIQTVRHRDHFVAGEGAGPEGGVPGVAALAWSAALLVVSLIAVIALAKTFAAVVETGIARIGAPEAAAGVIVAILILLPESVAAIGAARRDQLQTSINLALGSSIATIGLTIPAVAIMATVFGLRLVLGLDPRDLILLALTLLVSLITFAGGRTNILFGIVHLVVFATYLFLVFVP